ncbi:hypothetical protein K402DRAFT_388882 [Aulographum hederae CBS 113979]|uniref:Mus7/MMS22 family-domain-containing protein n=1 Tax=Aulographum hederae CBS 113979 TaxID=1176131 RepID=A0A6G1HEI3_9PEZI|nr:hypothetical protein K402DRAFT_388882 [Aulographum hederae CBS 113979]
MSTWRERGFVPDSDEEEEDLESSIADVKERDGHVQNGEAECSAQEQKESDAFPSHLEEAVESTERQEVEFEMVDRPPRRSQSSPTVTIPPRRKTPPVLSLNALKIPGQRCETQSPVRTGVDNDNDSSNSPLSSLCSDTLEFIASRNVEIFPEREPGLPIPAPLAAKSTIDQELPTGVQEAEEEDGNLAHILYTPVYRNVGERNLRKRNEAQLHPFQVERMRYERECRARGIKPVRDTTSSRIAAAEESQTKPTQKHQRHHSTNLNEQSEDDDFSLATESQSQEPSGPRDHYETQPSDPVLGEDVDTDDELPDLSTFLRQQTKSLGGPAHQSNKRRKLAHTFKTGTPTTLQRMNIPPRVHTTGGDIYEVPPSPPPTSSTSSVPSVIRPHQVRSQFIYPPGFVPQKPLSPGNSSDTKQHSAPKNDAVVPVESSPEGTFPSVPGRRRFISLSSHSESDAELEEVDAGSVAADDVLADGVDAEAEPSDTEIRRMQRRIKGVLPASWLRLDQQGHESGRKPARAPLSRFASEHHRGLAKKVIRAHDTTPLSHTAGNMFVLSDDSDGIDESISSDVLPEGPPSFQDENMAPEVEDPLPSFVETPDDVIEEDFIDPMFPTASKPAHRTEIRRKRQLKITDSVNIRSKRLKSSRNLYKGQDHAVSSSRTKVKARTIAPKRPAKQIIEFSIVDRYPVATKERSTAPDFIRLAAREASKCPNQGKQVPTRKQIRLQTLADTNEVNESLREWRAGTKPRQTASNPKRAPLADMPNHQQTLPPPLSSHFNDTRSVRPKKDLISKSSWRSKPQQTHLKYFVMDKTRSRVVPNLAATVARQPHAPRRPMRNQKVYRSAQLETLEDDFHGSHHQAAFRMQLQRENRAYNARRLEGVSTNPQLDRFLSGPDSSTVAPVDLTVQEQNALDSPEVSARPKNFSRRKFRPRRLDADTREYRQPSEPMPSELTGTPSFDLADRETTDDGVLQGLGPFGTRFTTDFDVTSLDRDTFFHESTFTGSGGLVSVLAFGERNLDTPSTYPDLCLNGKTYTWASWNEDMAADLDLIFDGALAAFSGLVATEGSVASEVPEETTVTALKQLVLFVARGLSFSDPIDRRACVQRLSRVLERACDAMRDHTNDLQTRNDSFSVRHFSIRVVVFLLLLAYQTMKIAKHQAVDSIAKFHTETVFRSCAKLLSSQLFPHMTVQLRNFLEENRKYQVRETGISNGEHAVESLLVLFHVLEEADMSQFKLWNLFNEAYESSIKRTNKLRKLEEIWLDIFTVLPFHEIGRDGMLVHNPQSRSTSDNWDLVNNLLGRVFSLYPATSRLGNPNMNSYLRAVLIRCHGLIANWNWRHCGSVIKFIFDFFAEKKLAPLPHEQYHGSPAFLESLDQAPLLAVLPEDRAFAIFLKVAAVGLTSMHSVYTDKRIRDTVYRCTPNHGRTYRKDENLRQEDLDALRNHHDLLCTLYWASPPGSRPRLSLISNLVDHGVSHREACRLNVRAWSNLVRFQASTCEPTESLKPFAAWYREIVEQTISLYKLARTEAESEYKAANERGQSHISDHMLQATISGNQKQALATLLDAVTGLKNAIHSAKDEATVTNLLQITCTSEILGLFDPKSVQLTTVLTETMNVFNAFVTLIERCRRPKTMILQESEESQDYGEWPELEDVEEVSPRAPTTAPATSDPLAAVHDVLAQFLSNCFGAEASPDDVLVTRVVDSWSLIAQCSVRTAGRMWSWYIDGYNSASWSQLRDTEQTRKYTAYFLATCLDNDPAALSSSEPSFVSAWLVSLVEREAKLRYQNRLTSALLNANPSHRLLSNLPFSAHRNMRYNITPDDIRQRRIALISAVLANMREALYEETLRNDGQTAQVLRRQYAENLKQLMTAMKKNYLELSRYNEKTTGDYVTFVQKVVELLQQYSFDICSVDKFFMDPKTFPLPVNDPKYVVARLRSYAVRVSEAGTAKKLCSFLQSVSERAAEDDQQLYLSDQLCSAMSNTFERGNKMRPSLRFVLAHAMFPAYIGFAFKTSAGWILAQPVLTAFANSFDGLLDDFDIMDPDSCDTVLSIVTVVLMTLQQTVELLVDHSGLLEQAQIQHVLCLIFKVVLSTLVAVDYLDRSTHKAYAAKQCITYFRSFSRFVSGYLNDSNDVQAPLLEEGFSFQDQSFAEVREFCAQSLDKTLQKVVVRQGDEYYIVRGSTSKAIKVDLQCAEEERKRLLQAIERFEDAAWGLWGDDGGGTEMAPGRRHGLGLEDIFL